jgi:uncharacterized membrane protein YqjE
MSDPAPGPLQEPPAPRLRERVGAALQAAGDLLATRMEIFREEAGDKGAHLARGIGAFVVAAALAFMTTFLTTALLVALFTLLFGRLWAGILATLVLFVAAAAAAVMLGWKALSKVRPFDFPVTGGELAKDWEALQRATFGDDEPEDFAAPVAAESLRPTPIDDVEARFRAGSE